MYFIMNKFFLSLNAYDCIIDYCCRCDESNIPALKILIETN